MKPVFAEAGESMNDSEAPKTFRTLNGALSGEEPDEPSYFCFSATLRIQGENIPFDEITNRLCVQPTHIHRKGDRRSQRHEGYNDDAWHFKPSLPETESLERHIEALWQVVKPEVAYIKALKQKFQVDVSVVIVPIVILRVSRCPISAWSCSRRLKCHSECL